MTTFVFGHINIYINIYIIILYIFILKLLPRTIRRPPYPAIFLSGHAKPNEGRSILWIGAIDTGLGYIADTHYYQIDLYFSCFAGIPSEIDLCTRMDSTKG